MKTVARAPGNIAHEVPVIVPLLVASALLVFYL
jgi:hypothetical protein